MNALQINLSCKVIVDTEKSIKEIVKCLENYNCKPFLLDSKEENGERVVYTIGLHQIEIYSLFIQNGISGPYEIIDQNPTQLIFDPKR